MENVPDRLLEVYQPNRDDNRMNIITKYASETGACEFDLQHIDHTLGYVIKYELEQMPEVEYVGIKLPHPLE